MLNEKYENNNIVALVTTVDHHSIVKRWTKGNQIF